MCTPTAAVQGLGAIASFGTQMQQTNAYNQSAATAHRDASMAAQGKYEGEQRSLIADTRQALSQGYDAELKARESQASARASSTFGGISMNDILSAERQKAATNAAKVTQFVGDAKDSYGNNVKAFEQEASGRINSTPFKAGPSLVNLGLEIAGTTLDSWDSPKNIFKD